MFAVTDDAPSTRGLIVARLPFGNSSLILRCVTEPRGRLTLLAKGALRPKSPFSGLLDLFYLADFTYIPSRTGEMQTLREARLLEAHLGLRRSYANLLAAHYFAALIESATEPGTPIAEESQLLAKAIGYLASHEVSHRVVERFEQRLLALARGGVAVGDTGDFVQNFHALHFRVPPLRNQLLALL